jgi:hypothetical protein
MATQVQWRGGSTAEHATFTGAAREITVDTQKQTLVVHDGSTVGGEALLREDGSNAALSLGSAGTPSLKFTGDTNTGIYSPGADQVAVATNGTGRLFIDASGNVQIGSSFAGFGNGSGVEIERSTTSTLRLTGNSGVGCEFFNTGSLASIQTRSAIPFTIQTNELERLRITEAGLVGIGTSSPTGKLDVRGSATNFDGLRVLNTETSSGVQTSAAIRLGITNSIGAVNGIRNCRIQATENNADANEVHLDFYTNSAVGLDQETVKMRLTSGGALGIGSTLSGNANNRLLVRSESASAITNVLLLNNGAANSNAGQGVRLNLSGISEVNSDIRYAYIEAATQTTGNDHYLAFGTNAPSVTPVERMRIDSSGRLLVGTSSARDNYFNTSGLGGLLQVEGANSQAQRVVSNTYGIASGAGPIVVLAKHRSNSIGGNTVVQSGDYCGELSFQGSDGTEFVELANIAGVVDGTPGANDMPGRLVFSTTADGDSSPTERMRITATGLVSIKSDSGFTNGIKYDNGATSSAQHYDRIYFGAASYYIINNSSVGVRLDDGATSWSAQSDERLKTNLTEISDGLGKIGTLRAVTGRYLNDETTVSRSFLIAQDVRDVLPEAVSEDNDDSGTLNLRYTEVIPLLVAALKESKERIEQLETEMAAVKAQLA